MNRETYDNMSMTMTEVTVDMTALHVSNLIEF